MILQRANNYLNLMYKKINVVAVLLHKLMSLGINFFYKVKEKKCDLIFALSFFAFLFVLRDQISFFKYIFY